MIHHKYCKTSTAAFTYYFMNKIVANSSVFEELSFQMCYNLLSW